MPAHYAGPGDLGGGVVALRTDAGLVAIDLFTGDEVWRVDEQLSPELVVGEWLVTTGHFHGARVVLDRRTGAEHLRRPWSRPRDEDAITNDNFLDEFAPLGPSSVAAFSGYFPHMQFEPVGDLTLERFDLPGGGGFRIDLPPMHLGTRLRATKAGVVAGGPDGLVAVDRAGEVLWSRRNPEERLTLLARPDDGASLLVGVGRAGDQPWSHDGVARRMELLDAATGRSLASHTRELQDPRSLGLLGGELLLLLPLDPDMPLERRGRQAVVAYDLDGLRETWRVELPGHAPLLARTQDGLVALERTRAGPWRLHAVGRGGVEVTSELEVRVDRFGYPSLDYVACHVLVKEPAGRDARLLAFPCV